MKSLYLYFSILLQNKQKPSRNVCKKNVWPTCILILWNIEFKSLIKMHGDKAFRASFKFPRHEWDQRFADFNRFIDTKTWSCYSCLKLHLHGCKLFWTSTYSQVHVLFSWKYVLILYPSILYPPLVNMCLKMKCILAAFSKHAILFPVNAG